MRMLLPSLYFLEHDGLLADDLKIIGAARSDESRDDYVAKVRAAVEAATYEEARAANLAATGGRTSVSAQAYALREKVLQVDAWVRGRPGTRVIEVHPEVSFARMAGAPLLARKKDADGVHARRE